MNRFSVFLLLLVALPAIGSQVQVECTGVKTDSDQAHLLIKTSAQVPHKIFTLDRPDRVVIDIDDARLAGKLPKATTKHPTIIGLRSGVRNQRDLRIVVDLKRPVRVKSTYTAPSSRSGHGFVVDLMPADRPLSAQVRTDSARPAPPRAVSTRARDAVIALDAGHGGKDPGAIGRGGTLEKDVTLAIARKLARLVDREPGMRAVMIRDGDEFITLRERIAKARKLKADLFISIHADAFNNPDARGSSVYTLSNGGATSEAAMWLADKENSVDLIGGVYSEESEGDLVSVLLEMAQNATIEHSAAAASAVLMNLGNVGEVHHRKVQRAGFVVLKSPDIPSLLVETAFISNHSEEMRLRSGTHQQRLAQAILAGIRKYFRQYPPQVFLSQETHRTDSRRYEIARGDTLSEIAQRYRVSLSSLRAENGLREGDMIRVGQVLSIPEDS